MFGWLGKKKESKSIPKEVEIDNKEDSEIEKEGIDPIDTIPDEPATGEQLSDFYLEYDGYLEMEKQDIIAVAEEFNGFSETDETRHEFGHVKGGIICGDIRVQKKLRSIIKEIAKQIGKKILTGSLSLTKISFPIKSMIPKSALETTIHHTCLFPLYIIKAASISDPLERFKLVIAASISANYFTVTFMKPLNPVIGETLQAEYKDGTQIYCEQISHHPPISYFLLIGPDDLFRYFGCYDYDAKSGLNSLTILNKGKRTIQFKDGQRIDYGFQNDLYSGSLIGQLKLESFGKIQYIDKINGFSCDIRFGEVKKKPTDFITGNIMQNGKILAAVSGTYLGYIDIDGKRYFDHRLIFPHKIKKEEMTLQSDHQRRNDLKLLKSREIVTAQDEKERMEEFQRKDAKQRQEYLKLKQKKK